MDGGMYFYVHVTVRRGNARTTTGSAQRTMIPPGAMQVPLIGSGRTLPYRMLPTTLACSVAVHVMSCYAKQAQHSTAR